MRCALAAAALAVVVAASPLASPWVRDRFRLRLAIEVIARTRTHGQGASPCPYVGPNLGPPTTCGGLLCPWASVEVLTERAKHDPAALVPWLRDDRETYWAATTDRWSRHVDPRPGSRVQRWRIRSVVAGALPSKHEGTDAFEVYAVIAHVGGGLSTPEISAAFERFVEAWESWASGSGPFPGPALANENDQ